MFAADQSRSQRQPGAADDKDPTAKLAEERLANLSSLVPPASTSVQFMVGTAATNTDGRNITASAAVRTQFMRQQGMALGLTGQQADQLVDFADYSASADLRETPEQSPSSPDPFERSAMQKEEAQRIAQDLGLAISQPNPEAVQMAEAMAARTGNMNPEVISQLDAVRTAAHHRHQQALVRAQSEPNSILYADQPHLIGHSTGYSAERTALWIQEFVADQRAARGSSQATAA